MLTRTVTKFVILFTFIEMKRKLSGGENKKKRMQRQLVEEAKKSHPISN
jgi:hypothetical protein